MVIAGTCQLFLPSEHGGEAYGYALLYARLYLPMIYVQLVGHVLHSYMRSLGAISTVLGITVLGCLTRIIATLSLIPRLQMEGVYLGQVISWGLDAMLSILLYLLLFRTTDRIQTAINKATAKKTPSRGENHS